MFTKNRLLFVLLCLLVTGLAMSVDPDPAGLDPLITSNQDLADPGPHGAGLQTVTVPQPGGGSFTAQLYYPATTTGNNTPYDPTAAPYPAISFGHGFLQSPSTYQSTLEHLATWGYFVIASESQLGLFPNHQQFADDLSTSLTYLENEHANPASWLFGQVDTANFGMSGHSMGGGASILATAADSRVVALANLAAAETNPSAIDQMPNINVPVSLITGSDDTIVSPNSNGKLMYQAGNAPRQLPRIEGGFHCGFQDSSGLFCDSGSLDRTTQLAITRHTLTAFFNLYLKADQTVWDYVWGIAMVRDNEVSTFADPGMAMQPFVQRQSSSVGDTLTYNITLRNTGDVADSYDILTSFTNWGATVSPANTGLLNPGDTATITVEVTVSGSAGNLNNNKDAAVISTRSTNDGLTRQIAVTITTRQ